ECHKFLSVAQEYQSYMAFWLALQFGLRFSEVLGLQWENIDFKNKTLHVEQAYHEREKKLGRLKTDSSRRSIPLSEQQAEFLKQYKENQKPKTNIVVANSQGNFMMKRNVRRAMKRICERAGVKEITFHELRHTHATLMLEMNEHIKIVQQRLGHVKDESTVNIYSHLLPQASNKDRIIVANSQNNFIIKMNFRRAMKRICERAGVKEITFHELRHTHATLMLEMNEHIKIVQQRLGHVKAETTVNIYSHVRPQVHH